MSTMGKPYRLVMWCRDCTGIDPKGCFDGGTEELDERFATLRLAVDAGYKIKGMAPWEFDVYRGEDEIDFDQMTERQIDAFDGVTEPEVAGGEDA